MAGGGLCCGLPYGDGSSTRYNCDRARKSLSGRVARPEVGCCVMVRASAAGCPSLGGGDRLARLPLSYPPFSNRLRSGNVGEPEDREQAGIEEGVDSRDTTVRYLEHLDPDRLQPAGRAGGSVHGQPRRSVGRDREDKIVVAFPLQGCQEAPDIRWPRSHRSNGGMENVASSWSSATSASMSKRSNASI